MLSLLEQNREFSKAGGFINLVSSTLSEHLTCTSDSSYCSEQVLKIHNSHENYDLSKLSFMVKDTD